MQHELERLGTTPSQLIVVIRVGCPTCMLNAAGRSGEDERDRDRLLGNDQTGLSFLGLYCRMRFRRELEYGCLLAFI